MTNLSDGLGDRMKGYETVSRSSLTRRLPVILRVDGKAFHTLTQVCDKPVDSRFTFCMLETAIALCSNIQGAKTAYVQSDEISVLLTDYETIQTQGWFNYEVQKMTSIGASIASVAFYTEYMKQFPDNPRQPVFDGRVFTLPKEEVTNYFIWRSQDATRNSINALGQSHFSHRELQNKNTDEVQEMLMTQRNINWNDCPVIQKRGACIVKTYYDHEAIDPRTNEKSITQRSLWKPDLEIPIFTQDRNYIEKYT